MNLYETTFIINPQADDATIDRQVKAVTDLITVNNGKILREERLGTRRLAYEIKGLIQGYYTSLIFEAPPETPSILSRHFKLEEPYIRYLTVLFEGSLEGEKVDGALVDKPTEAKPIPETPVAPPVPETAASEPTETEPIEATVEVVEPVATPEEPVPPVEEPAEADSLDETAIPVESQERSSEQERPADDLPEKAIDEEGDEEEEL